MEAFIIKKYFSTILLVLLVSFLMVGCNNNEEKKEFSTEEKQLMSEARDVVEEFNSMYVAKSEEDLKTIIEHTWIESDTVYDTMKDTYQEARSMNYEKYKIEFSEEDIVTDEDLTLFRYTAKTVITLTDAKGHTQNYNLKYEYHFKKTEDGSYKLEKIESIG